MRAQSSSVTTSWPDEVREAVKSEAERCFGHDNPFGVIGYQIGARMTRGQEVAGPPTLRVFVRRKLDFPRHAIPALRVRVGRSVVSLRPDVIAMGDMVRAHASSFPSFSGLHPGAAIKADGSRTPRYGAAGVLLATGSKLTHLLTAGHLFDRRERDVPVVAAESDSGQRVTIGSLARNFLDDADPNIGHPIDVALVKLTRDGVDLARHATHGRWPRVSDVWADDAGGGMDVVAFLPTTNDYSPSTRVDEEPVASVTVSTTNRGHYDLTEVWRVPHVGDSDGDSGTCLVTSSTTNYAVLGLCVGSGGHASIFEPTERAIAAAGRALSQPLTIWKV